MIRFMLWAIALWLLWPLAVAAQPVVRLDRWWWDFGQVMESKPVSHCFLVANLGDQPLILKLLSTSCGCTRVHITPRQLAPAAEGQITIWFDPRDREGRFRGVVKISTNDPHHPILFLELHANVVPALVLSDDIVDFGQLQQGQTPQAVVTLFSAYRHDLQILRLVSPSPFLQVGFERVAKPGVAACYQIRIKVRSQIPWGRTDGQLLIVTNAGKRQVYCVADVIGPIRIQPLRVSMALIQPGQTRQRRVLLAKIKDDFEVQQVHCTPSFVKTALQVLVPRQRFRIKLTVVWNQSIANGAFEGCLIIRTTHPQQPVITIPLEGFISRQNTCD